MLKVSQDFTVAPYYITFIVYITEPTLFYGFRVSLNVVNTLVNSIY
jgi:hypothetical protein